MEVDFMGAAGQSFWFFFCCQKKKRGTPGPEGLDTFFFFDTVGIRFGLGYIKTPTVSQTGPPRRKLVGRREK